MNNKIILFSIICQLLTIVCSEDITKEQLLKFVNNLSSDFISDNQAFIKKFKAQAIQILSLEDNNHAKRSNFSRSSENINDNIFFDNRKIIPYIVGCYKTLGHLKNKIDVLTYDKEITRQIQLLSGYSNLNINDEEEFFNSLNLFIIEETNDKLLNKSSSNFTFMNFIIMVSVFLLAASAVGIMKSKLFIDSEKEIYKFFIIFFLNLLLFWFGGFYCSASVGIYFGYFGMIFFVLNSNFFLKKIYEIGWKKVALVFEVVFLIFTLAVTIVFDSKLIGIYAIMTSSNYIITILYPEDEETKEKLKLMKRCLDIGVSFSILIIYRVLEWKMVNINGQKYSKLIPFEWGVFIFGHIYSFFILLMSSFAVKKEDQSTMIGINILCCLVVFLMGFIWQEIFYGLKQSALCFSILFSFMLFFKSLKFENQSANWFFAALFIFAVSLSIKHYPEMFIFW